jgi:putative membrane protein
MAPTKSLWILFLLQSPLVWSFSLRLPTETPRPADNKVPVIESNSDSKKVEKLLQDFSRDLDQLSILRPGEPTADLSAPQTLISAGSSYTRLWTTKTWEHHSFPPHIRYSRHLCRWHLSTTARKILPAVLASATWAAVVSLATKRYSRLFCLVEHCGPAASASLLSAPLALLLSLRSNASLGRLNEARVLVGRLVLHARTLSDLMHIYLYPGAPAATLLAARHLALMGWSLKAYVRGESPESEFGMLQTLLDPPNAQFISQQPKTIVALPCRVRQLCALAFAQIQESSSPRHIYLSTVHLLVEEQIGNLEQVMGGCERLHGSPIPPTYSRHLSRLMVLSLLILPVSLVAAKLSTTGVVLATTIASYVLIGIDEVGMEIENSFQLLPMQQLASAVQAAVRNQFLPIGGDAPPPLNPE